MRLAEEMKALRLSPLPDSLLDVSLRLVSSAGRYHSSHSCPRTTVRWKPPPPGEDVVLSSLRPGQLCTWCTEDLLALASPALEVAVAWMEVNRVRERSLPDSSSTRLITRLALLREQRPLLLSRLSHDDALEGHVSSLLALLDEEISAISATLQSPERLEPLLEEVRLAAASRELLDQGFLLDETPCLVGLYPFSNPTRRLAALAEVAALRTGETTVLALPRFVAEWAARTHRTMLVTAAPLTPSTSLAVQETAAHLWDPAGEAALSSLVSALQAATAL